MLEKTFFVAGVQHHQIHNVLDELRVGDDLDLVPEPDNKYDPNAVRIEYDSTMLGYVPKKFSSEISAMIEISPTQCKISKLNKTAKPWEMLEVTISPISDEDIDEEDLDSIMDDGSSDSEGE